MRLDRETLREIVREVVTTRTDELSCSQCFDHLDNFAEVTLVGKNAAQAMPLVQHHLEHCGECREEFEALLFALRGLSAGIPPNTRGTIPASEQGDRT
jgi:hypothetical protein